MWWNIWIRATYLLQLFTLVCINADDVGILRKCCKEGEGLAKVIDVDVEYRCVSRQEAEKYSNKTEFTGTIVVANFKRISYGFPEGCDGFNVIEKLYNTVNYSSDVHCIDKVILTLHNISKEDVPNEEVITLSCNETNTDVGGQLEIDRIWKCCAEGEKYDPNGHNCVKNYNDADSTVSLVRRFVGSVEPGIFTVHVGLRCSSDAYSIPYIEEKFEFEYSGRQLRVRDRLNGQLMIRLDREEYCVDRSADTSGLIVRACQNSCVPHATCVRKCCPFGQHHVPRVCGRGAKTCVPGNHPFIPKFYGGRYMGYKQIDAPDWLGTGPALSCTDGRYGLTNSSEDEHFLNTRGEVIFPNMYKFYPIEDYCMETMDRSGCPGGGGVSVETIMCFIKPEKLKYKFQISLVMISISCVFLALTLLVYLSLSELRNLHGLTLICHVSSMLLAYGCLIRVQYGHIALSSLCKLHGYLIYFAFVAAFSWLCVMCFDIWWTFGSIKTVQHMQRPGAERRRFAWYSLCAWGAPVLFTTVVFLLDAYPVSDYLDANIGYNFCWFGSLQNDKTDWPHYIFFVIPMGVVTGVNLVLWVCTARYCARVKSELHRVQAGSFTDRAKLRFHADKAKYTLVVKLWVVMGAGWTWEVLSTVVEEPSWLWMCVDLINQLQGFFIFIILVLKPKVYMLIRKKLGLDKSVGKSEGRPISTRSTFLSRSTSSDDRTRRISHQPATPHENALLSPPVLTHKSTDYHQSHS